MLKQSKKGQHILLKLGYLSNDKIKITFSDLGGEGAAPKRRKKKHMTIHPGIFNKRNVDSLFFAMNHTIAKRLGPVNNTGIKIESDSTPPESGSQTHPKDPTEIPSKDPTLQEGEVMRFEFVLEDRNDEDIGAVDVPENIIRFLGFGEQVEVGGTTFVTRKIEFKKKEKRKEKEEQEQEQEEEMEVAVAEPAPAPEMDDRGMQCDSEPEPTPPRKSVGGPSPHLNFDDPELSIGENIGSFLLEEHIGQFQNQVKHISEMVSQSQSEQKQVFSGFKKN